MNRVVKKVFLAALVAGFAGMIGCAPGDESGTVSLPKPNGNGMEVQASANAIAVPSQWLDLSSGNHHVCGIAANNSLWCWGNNMWGEVGDGSTTQKNFPTHIGADLDWKTLALGEYHSCALKNSGSLYCWGENDEGQVGDGTTVTARVAPTVVNGDTNWAAVDGGGLHTCALKTNGTLWCWGYDSDGRLGDNGAAGTIAKSPIPIGSATDWKQVSAGGDHSCGIKNGRTLWCWGDNSIGQLGDKTTVNKTVPTRIGKDKDWSQVSAGYLYTCARKTDGTLWCWGYNDYGTLGIGNTVTKTSPVKVGTAATWSEVFATAFHTCARQKNNSLWCWGGNDFGQLGRGNTVTPALKPTKVGTGWNLFETGWLHSCASKSDQSLWCWGDNEYGQIGDGTTINRSLPTRVFFSFSIADQAGNWTVHALVSAVPPNWNGWYWLKWAFDNAGNSTCTGYKNSSGDRTCLSPLSGWAVSSDGIVTESTLARYHGVMAKTKDMKVFTMDDDGGGSQLAVAFKTGGTNFSTANLKGTWYSHELVAGNTPTVWVGWQYIKWQFDGSGNSTCLKWLDSGGSHSCNNRDISGWSVSNTGTITIPGQSTLNGTLSLDKSMGVATVKDGKGGPCLVILTKTSTIPFSTADLQGTWYLHALSSGNGRWFRIRMNIDGLGNATCLEALDSDGDAACFPGTDSGWTVAADGVIANSGRTSLHGIMSTDKQTMVMTLDDDGDPDAYDLWVMVKMR